jgi:hypothetical protein
MGPPSKARWNYGTGPALIAPKQWTSGIDLHGNSRHGY